MSRHIVMILTISTSAALTLPALAIETKPQSLRCYELRSDLFASKPAGSICHSWLLGAAEAQVKVVLDDDLLLSGKSSDINYLTETIFPPSNSCATSILSPEDCQGPKTYGTLIIRLNDESVLMTSRIKEGEDLGSVGHLTYQGRSYSYFAR